MMKKLLVIALAAIMLVTMSACSVKNVTRYAYAGDDAFYNEEFNFFLAQAMGTARQTAQNSGDSLEKEEDWKTVKIGDKTAEEFVKDEASKSMKQYIVLMAKAKELGEEFTKEDEASLTQQRQSIIDNYGGRYSYEQYFKELGFTVNAVENVIRANIFAQKVYAYFEDPEASKEAAAEGDTEAAKNASETTEKPNFYSLVKVSDEEVAAKYKEDYVMAKHILIMPEKAETAAAGENTTESSTKAKTEEELNDDAKAKAEDVINQLKNGADFDTLMTKYTQDLDSEGKINGATGYIFTKGEMVPEFENAAYALKEGEFTQEPVKTDYGYHIIYRLPLPSQGEDYTSAIEKVKSKLQTEKMDNLIEQWAGEFGFKLNEKAIKRAKLHI